MTTEAGGQQTPAGWTVTVSKTLGNRLISLHSPSEQLSSHFLTDMVHILGDKSFLIILFIHSTGEDMDYLGYPMETDCYTYSAQQIQFL
jgi:hypothetical protein